MENKSDRTVLCAQISPRQLGNVLLYTCLSVMMEKSTI
jgi:hypothetical protein